MLNPAFAIAYLLWKILLHICFNCSKTVIHYAFIAFSQLFCIISPRLNFYSKIRVKLIQSGAKVDWSNQAYFNSIA